MAEPTLEELTANRKAIEAQLAESTAKIEEMERVREIQIIKNELARRDAEEAQIIRNELARRNGQQPQKQTELQKAEAEIPRTPQDPASATQVPQGAPPTIPTGGAPGQKPEDRQGAAALKVAGGGKPDATQGFQNPIMDMLGIGGALQATPEPVKQAVGQTLPAQDVKALVENKRDVAITAGEIGGAAVGLAATPVLGPFGPISGAAAGAGGMSMVMDVLEGKDVDHGKAALEAGFSTGTSMLGRFILKPAAKLTGRALDRLGITDRAGEITRKFFQGTKAKTPFEKKLAKEQNLAIAEQQGAEALQKRAADQMANFNRARSSEFFEAASESGDKLSTQGIKDGLSDRFEDEEWKLIRGELRKIAAPEINGKKLTNFGPGVAKQMDEMRVGESPIQAVRIEVMQQIRSQIQKKAVKTADGAKKDALDSFVDFIDDQILNGQVVSGTGQGSEALLKGRSSWRKALQTEKFSQLVNRNITKSDKLAQGSSLNLGGLKDMMDHPKPGREAELIGSMKELGTFDSLRTWVGNMQESFRRVGMETRFLDEEQVSEILWDTVQNPTQRALLGRAIRDNAGEIPFEVLRSLANGARRRAMGVEAQEDFARQAAGAATGARDIARGLGTVAAGVGRGLQNIGQAP
jgi:hypothetical protein